MTSPKKWKAAEVVLVAACHHRTSRVAPFCVINIHKILPTKFATSIDYDDNPDASRATRLVRENPQDVGFWVLAEA